MASRNIFALFVGAALSTSALAGTVTINGDTTGGPTWNRPVQGNPPTPPPSGVGTNVSYQVTSFTVDQAGAYDFLSISQAPAGWDNYLFVYQTAFDPTAPFSNVIIGNDDFPTIGRSGFADVALAVGITYFAVSTGFANDDFGTYELTISGPGNIQVGNAVPEPATWAMMVGGFALAGAGLRARRRSVSFA